MAGEQEHSPTFDLEMTRMDQASRLEALGNAISQLQVVRYALIADPESPLKGSYPGYMVIGKRSEATIENAIGTHRDNFDFIISRNIKGLGVGQYSIWLGKSACLSVVNEINSSNDWEAHMSTPQELLVGGAKRDKETSAFVRTAAQAREAVRHHIIPSVELLQSRKKIRR